MYQPKTAMHYSASHYSRGSTKGVYLFQTERCRFGVNSIRFGLEFIRKGTSLRPHHVLQPPAMHNIEYHEYIVTKQTHMGFTNAIMATKLQA
jgi:hypothetical protein